MAGNDSQPHSNHSKYFLVKVDKKLNHHSLSSLNITVLRPHSHAHLHRHSTPVKSKVDGNMSRHENTSLREKANSTSLTPTTGVKRDSLARDSPFNLDFQLDDLITRIGNLDRSTRRGDVLRHPDISEDKDIENYIDYMDRQHTLREGKS